LSRLEQMGHPVGSHSASIDAGLADRVKEGIRDGRGDAAEETADESWLDPASSPTGEFTRPQETEGETLRARRERERAEAEAARPPRWVEHLKELPILIIFALVVAVMIKTFLIQAFFIPSESMVPTLMVGDRVLVEKVSYVFGDPAPGQVVVFEKSVFGQAPDLPWYDDARNFLRELLGLPTGGEEDYIKRIVAVGGDRISYTGKPRRLEVNGEVIDEPYLARPDRASPTLTSKDCRRLKMLKAEDGCLVPAGRVFVMGDNRPNSEDSRFLGPVDEDKIVGHAFVIIWPPGDFGGL
jgi:signal peptidase I